MVLENGLSARPPEDEPDRTCCHHWIIQPAVGPVSEGACQKCGEVKEFKNSIDYETEWSGRRDLVRSDIGLPTRHSDDVDELAG